MTDAATDPSTVPSPSPEQAPKPDQASKKAFAFTDPGCRTDIRAGALLILGAVFLWLWFGPQTSAKIYLVGAPLLVWGVPWQALQARSGRPGFPWKLGVAMTILGVAMWPGLRFQNGPGEPIEVQIIAPLLTAAGAWILLWWPVAFWGRLHSEKAEQAETNA